MADILIRGLDDAIAERLRDKAKREGRSLNDISKDALTASVAETREELWARINARRNAMGLMPDDSTDIIRALRDGE
jgi:plasmid stability protein